MIRFMKHSALGLLALGVALAAQPDGSFFAGPGTHGAYLDGAPLLPGTAILPGDVVTTESGGAVLLTPTQGGGAIELAGGGSAALPGGSNSLIITKGNALVVGNVRVTTPQGATFVPGQNSSYVVNVGGAQAGMGVLSGSVKTLLGNGTISTVSAGSAIQVGKGNSARAIRFAELTRPDPNGIMPQVIPASQSR